LFFDIVDLLREPKSLIPADGTCVLHLTKRNHVMDRLLAIRRSVVLDKSDIPANDLL